MAMGSNRNISEADVYHHKSQSPVAPQDTYAANEIH